MIKANWKLKWLALSLILSGSLIADPVIPLGNCTTALEGGETVQTCTFRVGNLYGKHSDYVVDRCPNEFDRLKILYFDINKTPTAFYVYILDGLGDPSSLLPDDNCGRNSFYIAYFYWWPGTSWNTVEKCDKTPGIYIDTSAPILESPLVDTKQMIVRIPPDFFSHSPLLSIAVYDGVLSYYRLKLSPSSPTRLYRGGIISSHQNTTKADTLLPDGDDFSASGSGMDSANDIILNLEIDTGESGTLTKYQYEMHLLDFMRVSNGSDFIRFHNLPGSSLPDLTDQYIQGTDIEKSGRLNEAVVLSLWRDIQEGKDILAFNTSLPKSILSDIGGFSTLLLSIDKLRKSDIPGNGDCGTEGNRLSTVILCSIQKDSHSGSCTNADGIQPAYSGIYDASQEASTLSSASTPMVDDQEVDGQEITDRTIITKPEATLLNSEGAAINNCTLPSSHFEDPTPIILGTAAAGFFIGVTTTGLLALKVILSIKQKSAKLRAEVKF